MSILMRAGLTFLETPFDPSYGELQSLQLVGSCNGFLCFNQYCGPFYAGNPVSGEYTRLPAAFSIITRVNQFNQQEVRVKETRQIKPTSSSQGLGRITRQNGQETHRYG